MVGLVDGEKKGGVVDGGEECDLLKFRSLLNSGSTHLLMTSQGC